MISWLKAKFPWLSSEWMSSVTYLAFMAHSAWACAGVLAAFILGGLHAAEIATVVWMAFAAVKEFVFDANFEVPKQTAQDNWGDFGGYCAGLVLAWVLLVIQFKVR